MNDAMSLKEDRMKHGSTIQFLVRAGLFTLAVSQCSSALADTLCLNEQQNYDADAHVSKDVTFKCEKEILRAEVTDVQTVKVGNFGLGLGEARVKETKGKTVTVHYWADRGTKLSFIVKAWSK
jgi:hypothetical protein